MEYFNTFGGNPVSCAIGLAVLDVIEDEKLQEHALNTGNYLLRKLRELQSKNTLIHDIRGSGLFIGIEIASDHAKYIVNQMQELGILLSVDGPKQNVIKIKPPLVFTQENCDLLVRMLEKVMNRIRIGA